MFYDIKMKQKTFIWPNKLWGRPKKIRIHQFTLLELMVGMTILSILMLMLLQFLLSSQKTLDWRDSMWRIYENSRIVFDLIERDLQACVTSSTSGNEIEFYMGDPDIDDPDNAVNMCFVASTEPPNTNATSKLCEISYRFHQSSSLGVAGNREYTLYRRIISNADGPDWDLYDTDSPWYINDDINTAQEFQKVVTGIKNFSIKFDVDGNEYGVPVGGTDTTVKPTSVHISFDLFDESLIDAPMSIQAKTLRSFTKTVDLQKFN